MRGIKYWLEKAREEGFESLEDYIEANLHNLPEDKQRLFHNIVYLSKTFSNALSKAVYEAKEPEKAYYSEKLYKGTYNGKD